MTNTSFKENNYLLFAGKYKSSPYNSTKGYKAGYSYVMKGKANYENRCFAFSSDGSTLFCFEEDYKKRLITGGFSLIGNDNFGLGISTFN